MKVRPLSASLIAGLLGLGLAACAAPSAQPGPTTAPAAATAQASAPTAAAPTTITTAAALPTGATFGAAGITAEGEIVPIQDASLLFNAQGTVGQVLVREGDEVEAGQVLATLDTGALDLQVAQAEASLAGAQAQLAGLDEAARPADVAAAQAQVNSAQAALAQLKAGPKPQDVTTAQSSLATAQTNLQAQRNNFSAAKTQAESALQQAANNLRNAQDEYSRIYWQNRQLEKAPGDLPQANRDAETAAERAVANAEESLRQAQLQLDNARQAEQTGIQAGEQQVAQAQAALDKLLLPPTPDQVAAAEAQLAQARSQLDALTNPGTASQRAQAQASVAQAQASLDSARYNRGQAELKAPFAGVVAEVNIDAGDPSSSAGAAAIRLIDNSELSAEIAVSDVDIARVRVNQTAQLIVQSLPDSSFSGRVSYIAPAATVNGNVRSYMVRITIEDQSGLLAGMRVRATIEAE